MEFSRVHWSSIWWRRGGELNTQLKALLYKDIYIYKSADTVI